MTRSSLRGVAFLLVLTSCSGRGSEPAGDLPDFDAGLKTAALETQHLANEEPDALAVVRETVKAHPGLAYAFAHGNGLSVRDAKLSSPGDAPGDHEHLAARFPAQADRPFEVDVARMARLRISLAPIGASPVQAKLFEGRAVYADAWPSTDLVALGNAFYAEHLLVLRDAKAKASVSYRMELGKGLRSKWDQGALVLSDATGEPRLRVLAPFAVDARGVVRDAKMTLDRDELRIELDPVDLAYPIVLDPAIESFLWEKKAPTASPSARTDTTMAYDFDRKLTVLYGGSSSATSDTPSADTWEYNGTTWTQRCGAPLAACALPALSHHAMQYDAALKKTWLHGRSSSLVSWVGLWNGTAWTTTSDAYPPPATTPIATTNAGTAYDSVRSVVVEQGGGVGFGPNGDTWTWNGTWNHRVTSSGCPGSAPYCRYGGAMTYHAATDKVILFGGLDSTAAEMNTTWSWDGAAWSLLIPAASPSYRGYAQLVYDPARKRSILFGGALTYNNLDDTYEWTGTTWTAITPLTKPAARSHYGMAFDVARGRAVLFGGQVGPSSAPATTGETWEYHSHGAACTTGAECDTGSCVDGVCCETSSCGSCERCDGTSPGTCTKVISADDDTCKAPTATCNPLGVCKKLQGQVCATGTDCLNGICVDGVCCGTACTAVCTACKASLKADGKDDGTCGPAKSGVNPHTDCTSGVGGSCGQTGVCDGFGKCELQVPGTSCGTGAVCTGTVAKGQQCDGAGTCVTKATGTECAPGLCVAVTGCKATCATNSECATSAFCDTSTVPGQCKSKKVTGGACKTGSECTSTFCIDGVCCNSLCNEKCQACSAATKESGAGDGVCGAAKNGLNPHSDCIPGSGGTCGQSGKCDGAGSCSLVAAGATCGTGSVCDGTVAKGQQCDGLGACVNNPTGTDCVPGKCLLGCKLTCAVDGDCDSSGFCDPTTKECKAKKKNGTACAAASECENPFCVDGVCCNKPCGGQCEACNFKDAEGTCVPVTGAPVGGRLACDPKPEGSCEQTSCDGIDGTKCAGFVGATVKCQASACTDGKAFGEVHCDGKGKCPTDAPKTCEPYACGATACKDACMTNEDCKSPATCDTASGKCVNAAKCDGEHTLTSADGKTATDCTPFNCDASGTCKSSCASSSECAPPAICSVGVCAAPGEDTSSSGGCSVVHRKSDAGPIGLLFLALVTALHRASSRRR